MTLVGNAWLGWLGAWVLTGALVGAAIGFRRDRVLRGLLLGAVLGPIGWIVIARSRSGQVECPGCSRMISRAALVCPRCGTNVRAAQARSSRSAQRGVRGKPW